MKKALHVAGNAGELLYQRRRRIATGAVTVLALLVGYHVVFGANGITVFIQKRQDEKQLTQQMKTLAEENDRLHAHVERLQTDPNAIEHEARESLHYTRPGEVIYTMPDAPKK